MAFSCKHKPVCKILSLRKAFGCNFAGKKEIAVFSKTYAEDKNRVNGSETLLIEKANLGNKSTSDKTMKKPTHMDKVILMWNGTYNSPDEIPEYVPVGKLKAAIVKRRFIFHFWILCTTTIFLFAVIQSGNYRTRLALVKCRDDQYKAWEDMHDSLDEKAAQKNIVEGKN